VKDLPNISPGDGFEKEVMLRAWLQKLDKPEVPVGFDEAVLKSAKSGFPWATVLVSVAVVALMILGGLYWQSRPNPVDVVYVPQSPLPLTDLYNIPPAPVLEDERFKVVEPEPQPVLHGVAGY
jgi:hypothetical protein